MVEAINGGLVQNARPCSKMIAKYHIKRSQPRGCVSASHGTTNEGKSPGRIV